MAFGPGLEGWTGVFQVRESRESSSNKGVGKCSEVCQCTTGLGTGKGYK